MKIIFNDTELEVLETDDSFRYRKIMGENTLTLYFAGPNFLEIPLGAYVMYEGGKYTLTQNEDFKKVSSQHYDYTIKLCGASSTLSHIKVRNTVDRRLKFSYTAKAHEHLQLIVDNLNQRDSGWSVGSCVDSTEKVLSYNFTFCIDALDQLADLFNTEYDIRNKTISLCKVEYNKDNPLALSYGVGNGFKPNVGRKTPTSAKAPVEVLFVQGGEDNINPTEYGSTELLLPKLQTLTYEGREYVTDAEGYSIRRNDKDIQYNNEDGLDCTHIYPKRVGEITSVVVEDEENNFYDIIDTTVPDNLNYEDYLIDGETMTIIFQSGMLSGREFDVKYFHEATDDKAGKRFEIVPQELDGQTMPNETFKPRPEDTYAIFHCALPDAYICDNDTQSGASWDMFRDAAKYFYENEDPKFTFKGELDGLWSKSRWLEVGGKITLGGYILFTDEDFEQDGVKIRIIGIKDFVKKRYSPILELSNDVIGISGGSELDKIAAQEVDIIEAKKSAIRYARRGFRDVQETSEMLMDALLNFSGEINPIVVKTMQLIAGDESLQFRFVNNMTAPTTSSHVIVFNSATKILTSEAGIIQHMTLGVSSISSTHSVSEYKFWNVAQYTSPALTDPDKKYYLYIKASKSDQTATILLSETAIAIEGVADYYHFLVGFLNSEYDESRSFATLHGYSEVLPGQITTPLICSSDGLTYFNLDIGEIGGRIVFVDTDGNTTTIADGIDASKTAIAQQLGYASYDAMVEAAAAGNTVIVGGYVNTSLVEVDHLKTKGDEGQIVIDSDQVQVYDYDGDRKLIIDGGVYSSHDSIMNESSAPTVSAITSLPVNYSSTVQQSSPALTYSRSLTIGTFTIPTSGFNQVRVPALYFRFKSHEYSNYSSSTTSGYVGYISAEVMVGSQHQSVGFGIPSSAGGLIAVPNTDFEHDQTTNAFLITTTEGGEYTVTIEVSLTIESSWIEPTGNLDVEIEVRVADGENGDNLTYESFYNYSRLYSNGFLLRASSQKYFSLLNATNEPLINARDGDYYLEMVAEYISGYGGYRKYSNGQLEVWGYVSSSSTTGSVTFPNSITFTNAYYNIQTTISGTNTTTFADIRPYSLTTSGFSYRTIAMPTVTGTHKHYTDFVSENQDRYTYNATASITTTTSSGLPFYWSVKGRWK